MKKFIVLFALFVAIFAAPQVIDEIKTNDEPQTADEPEILDQPEVFDEPKEVDEPTEVDEPQIFDEPQVVEEHPNDEEHSNDEEHANVEELQIVEEDQIVEESQSDEDDEEFVIKSEKAQMFYNPMMMGGMNSHMMQPQSQEQQFPIDYSMSCSNSCNCGTICVPWWPCGCKCPPPCPPVTDPPPTLPPPLCVNGAPDFTFPWCCINGATNQFCCLNGADNPQCELATVPPPTVEPPPGDTPCNGGGCCKPCIPCMPCMVWWMCQPCGCNNGCATTTAPPIVEPPTLPPPLCWNGAPDFTFPWCCENGATNQFCCLNGADNPQCELPTVPPIVTPTPSPPCNGGGSCCQPCVPCMPCMIWWMCPPCGCNNGCNQETTTPTTSVPPPPPLCNNGAPDFTFPWCCVNGATNQFCCLNGADNPQCELPTIPPPIEVTIPPSNGCPCQPICRPCMPWFPCQPCSCPCSSSNSNQHNNNHNNRHEDVIPVPYDENDIESDQWQDSWNVGGMNHF